MGRGKRRCERVTYVAGMGAKMRTRSLVLMAVLMVLVLAGGCGPRGGRAVSSAGGALPQAVAAHSPGVIPAAGPIRVRFVDPVVDGQVVGSPGPSSVLRLSPPVPGRAIWTSTRDLVFHPDAPLKPGADYLVIVSVRPAGGERIRFGFRVRAARQVMELAMDGLSVEPGAGGGARLTGRLRLASTAAPGTIEKVVRARQDGRKLPVSWDHSADGRHNAFTITGIQRGEKPSTVELSWDGSAVGAARRGSKKITVPALETFDLLDARAVQGDQRSIELRFSDVLGRQTLRGLVTVRGRKDIRLASHGNVVQIFTTGVWDGEETVVVAPQLRSAGGRRLGREIRKTVTFDRLKPSVRFLGDRVILPTTMGLTLPMEAANLRSVVVEALQVFDSNVPQFLQVNDLDGERDLRRVGRVVWSDEVKLGMTPEQEGRWVRYGLDLTPLVTRHPGGLYRIRVRFRPRDILYPCPAGAPAFDLDLDGAGNGPGEVDEGSFWDSWEPFRGYSWRELYDNRFDPCHPGYYREYGDHKPMATRNVMVSDIGLIAKSGGERLVLAVTDIRTARPIAGARVEVLDYQQHPVATATTDEQGLAVVRPEHTPYLAVVRHEGQAGYLKLDLASALSLSNFDVAGAEVPRGVRGFLYGDRGVWRPGDTLNLSFILFDPEGVLPADHPVKLELRNPENQLVTAVTRTSGLDGFYTFAVATRADAPTGNYHAVVRVGDLSFQRRLKIETVRPNRLDLDLELDRPMITGDDPVLRGTLSAVWLQGATARKLKADLKATLRAADTRFERYAAYAFDDPTRRFDPQAITVFEGRLDGAGKARIAKRLSVEGEAPGRLSVELQARIFEPGGAFSTERFTTLFSPWNTYIGLLVPRGDRVRGMLVTDADHRIGLVAVGPDGSLRPHTRVKVRLYKLEWRWWWEKDGDELADYVASENLKPIRSDEVELRDGRGEWTLRIDSPDWGRYLLLAEDMEGGHRAGKVVYVDWPGWAGRGGGENPSGAAMLSLGADRETYHPGDRAVITIPTSAVGRGLVSLESASRVLRVSWIEGSGRTVRYTFEVTPEMAPNVYVHVTFIQPHLAAGNDLPIRLYGVIPIMVEDPKTRLEPVLEVPESFEPESTASFSVREAAGRPMTYTVALVDEGLLGLTGFGTPDPWKYFYRRQALGVRTWDLYDRVAGAYSGRLERLLAVGGDQDVAVRPGRDRANRFPAMVRFLGPFQLKAGATGRHRVEIPRYVGAVRIMVVAGSGRAFGSADARVLVKKPVMILGTLPRVMGPGEDVALPVSVFVMDDSVRKVTVRARVSGALRLVGPGERSLAFDGTGDGLVRFRVAAGERAGIGRVELEARGGGETVRQSMELQVRSPALPVADVHAHVLRGGESWKIDPALPGLPGSASSALEVSTVPPLDLGRRLSFLIRYPYGCVEQTISTAIAQLAIARVVDLSPKSTAAAEKNVRAAIQRLPAFQTPSGAFAYWPVAGGSTAARPDATGGWVTSWAGQFLVAARRAGYQVPPEMLERWKGYQASRARAWVTGLDRSQLIQAERLYTLALAGAPELGAMNRLRETEHLSPVAAWRLAAAYQLSGQPETAEALVRGLPMEFPPYRELGGTFGSEIRDRAMALESLAILGRSGRAVSLMADLSEALSGGRWLSTQDTAWVLLAMARAAGGPGPRFEYTWLRGAPEKVAASKPVWRRELPVGGGRTGVLAIRNPGRGLLYARLVVSGTPRPGEERPSAQGMRLTVRYVDLEGEAIDPATVIQGDDFKLLLGVRNSGRRGDYDNVALTVPVAAGWEIHNARLDTAHVRAGVHRDVRDDRVDLFFDLPRGVERSFEVFVHASYEGRFWQPMIQVEAMYDARINARLPGRWVEVVRPGAH